MPILMNEQLQTGPVTLEVLADSFMLEAIQFYESIRSPHFKQLLPRFRNYKKFLRTYRQRLKSGVIVKSLVKADRTISAAAPTPLLSDILLTGHFAACYELFNDWPLLVDDADAQQQAKDLVWHNLASLRAASPRHIAIEYDKFSRADTIRILHILQLIGLPAVTAHNRILSIGAGQGQRELNATNVEPKIAWTNATEPAGPKQATLSLSQKVTQPDRMILIDNDPFWQKPYLQLNAQMPDKAWAINDSWENTLSMVADKIAAKHVEQPNLFTLWRIEHEGFPNVDQFLEMLTPLAAPYSNLVMTIGAGNSDVEFQERQAKLKEFSAALAERGHRPTPVVLHHGDRLRPYFGSFRYTSYEVLHCTLN